MVLKRTLHFPVILISHPISLTGCVKNILIDSLEWLPRKPSLRQSLKAELYLPFLLDCGMLQWYVACRLWQKPQARPTFLSLLLICFRRCQAFSGSLIFPRSNVLFQDLPKVCSNQNFWWVPIPSIIDISNSIYHNHSYDRFLPC
jgi:hypothetical protein